MAANPLEFRPSWKLEVDDRGHEWRSGAVVLLESDDGPLDGRGTFTFEGAKKLALVLALKPQAMMPSGFRRRGHG